MTSESMTTLKGKEVITFDGVSKWFGHVVAVSDINFKVGQGVTGLLGPNGAGKTTILRLICGLASPSEGDVRLFGIDPRADHSVYEHIGIMSEHESAYEFMTGRQYVRYSAQLKRAATHDSAIANAVSKVAMEFAQDRKISTYSRGMRQRIRLAAAMVSDPELLILDEPLNGADPTQRINFHDILHRLAAEGRTVIISSHILEEVETVSDNVLLVISGKLAAEGDYHAIRAALDDRPYHVRIGCSDPRELASQLAKMPAIESLQFDPSGSIVALTSRMGTLQLALPAMAQQHGIRITRFEPLDDSLESVFEYLAE